MPTLVAFVGDSITAGANSTGYHRTYRDQVLKILGAQMSEAHINGGVGGERSEQLLTRLPSVLAEEPGVVFVMTGTNDAGQAIPLEDYQSNIIEIADMVRGSGTQIAFGLVPPRAANGPIMSLTHKYNLWLRQWCELNDIPCADTFKALVDPATGLMNPIYDTDGVHPNNAGQMQLAIEIAKEIGQFTATPKWPFVAAGIGLLPNPLMLNGTTGWDHRGGAFTPPVVIPGDGTELPAGNWCQLKQVNGTTNVMQSTYGKALGAQGGLWNANDLLLVGAYLDGPLNKMQLLDGFAPVNGTIIEQELPVSMPYGPVLRTVRIPSGITGILSVGFTLQTPAFSTLIVEVGAFDVLNLTQWDMEDLPV